MTKVEAGVSVGGYRSGPFDPVEVSRATGLLPTWTVRRTDLRRNGRPYNFDAWWLEVSERGGRKGPVLRTDPVLRRLLDTIWPARDQLRKFAMAHELHLSIGCAVVLDEGDVIMDMTPDTMKRLASFGEFGFDIYDHRPAVFLDDPNFGREMEERFDKLPSVRALDEGKEAGRRLVRTLAGIERSYEELSRLILDLDSEKPSVPGILEGIGEELKALRRHAQESPVLRTVSSIGKGTHTR